jgi:hypothetical protein
MKNLVTLWLAVTLVIAPLPGLAIGVAGAGADSAPCAMDLAGGTNSGTTTQALQGVSQGSATEHCPDCSDHSCDPGGGCSSQGCAGSHVQPAAIAAMQLHQLRHVSPRSILQTTCVDSRTDPPLLRPPA